MIIVKKQNVSAIFLLFIGLSSLYCSDIGDAVDPNAIALEGTWNWIKSVGGIVVMVITPETAGYTQSFRFTKGGTFSYLRNDVLYADGRFLLSHEQGGLIMTFTNLNIHHGDYFRIPKVGVSIVGDTLVINDLVIDGYFHTYNKAH